MFVKKSLILKSMDGSEKKAILTMENHGYETKGKLRLYNFPSEPLGIISLGIYTEGKVEKAGLTRCENMLYSFVCNLKNLPQNFSCAVVNFSKGDFQPILYGNSNGLTQESVFDNVVLALQESTSMKEVESILDDNNIDYEDELKQEIQGELDKCLGDCDNCEYKKFYFEQKLAQSQAIDEPSKEDGLNFYKEIKSQIEDLFEKNPTEEYLQNLIPNSKWVKVKVDENDNFYVLGLIYEDDQLKYICYGVPGVYQETPPRQLSGYPVWFALDENNPQNFGYWLSYQDASSGESVKAIVV
ncbi:MAG: hypothetical protein E7379_01220 [Clostridiales bacterium]|nr:hypothetical protein [Clostridiales bacterium]